MDASEANLESLMDNEVDSVRRKFQHPRISKEFQYLIQFIDRRGGFDVKE